MNKTMLAEDETSKTTFLFQILFGAVFLLAGLGAVFIFSITTELHCSRPEPSVVDCVRSSYLFGLWEIRQEPLGAITRAYLSESCDEDGCSYRVELVTDDGVTPLHQVYQGGIGAYNAQKEKVVQLLAFLEDKEQESVIIADNIAEKLMTLLPLLFVLIGGSILGRGLIDWWHTQNDTYA